MELHDIRISNAFRDGEEEFLVENITMYTSLMAVVKEKIVNHIDPVAMETILNDWTRSHYGAMNDVMSENDHLVYCVGVSQDYDSSGSIESAYISIEIVSMSVEMPNDNHDEAWLCLETFGYLQEPKELLFVAY